MKTICFAILSVSLISTAEACLPSSPADVLVGRIASIEKGGELQRESQAIHRLFRYWQKKPLTPRAKYPVIIGEF